MIQQVIAKLLNRESPTRKDVAGAMRDIMNGTASDAQIGAFIAAVRLAGETPEIIAGCSEVMRANATPIRCTDTHAIDIVGTGGDCANTFNISTTAAFVIAGAGVTVAKHGSYGVSSKCGSANVLSKLGVNLQYSPAQMEKCLNEIGIAFLFAPALHPAMKHVVGPRKELGVWSIFNILGPLCNPAGVKNGIIGVFSPRLIPLIAEACLQLKMEHLFIVHGNDGLDEFTTTTTTQVTEIFQGKLKTLEVSPADFNLPMVGSSELIGGEPTENATITRALLAGEKGPKRDIVLLNSTFAILASGKAQTPKEAFKMAAESIDSGKALAKLDALVKMSNE